MGNKLINLFNNNLLIFIILNLVIYDKFTIVNNYIYSLTTNFIYHISCNCLADFLFFHNNLLVLKFFTFIYIFILIFFAFTSKLKGLKKYASYLKIIILNKCLNIYSKLLSSDKKHISLNKIFINYNFKNIFLMTILFIYIFSLIQYKEIIENQELIILTKMSTKDQFNNTLFIIQNIDNFSIICNILIYCFYMLVILHTIIALYSIFYDYCSDYFIYIFTLTLTLIILILNLFLIYYFYKNCLILSYNFNDNFFVNICNSLFGSNSTYHVELDPSLEYYN